MYLTINSQPWLSTADKVRLLEWKIRLDLVQYAARGCPAISLESIESYVPKQPSEESVRGEYNLMGYSNLPCIACGGTLCI